LAAPSLFYESAKHGHPASESSTGCTIRLTEGGFADYDHGNRIGVPEMPVLPLIDLMLLSGWTALLVGFVLKVVHLTTSYRPAILGLTPIDFLMIAAAAMLFAIALAARTWVKSQEPTAAAIRRRDETIEAWNALKNGEARGADAVSEDVIAAGDPGMDRIS
jgi:hypothetical protein